MIGVILTFTFDKIRSQSKKMSAISELLRYLKICLIPKSAPLPNPTAQKSNLLVSLTTTPDRLPKIHQTLRSLIDQTVLPAAIYLNLPEKSMKGKAYEITSDLLNFPLLKINRPAIDQGPATKSLPVLADNSIDSDTIIVVLDDDQVYPKNLLETYYTNSLKFPEHALTICGWKTPQTLRHSDKKILRGAGLKLNDPNANISKNEEVEIIQGASSYAIKKRFFTSEIFDFDKALPKAMFADDIWISGQLAKAKTPRILLKADFAYCRIMSLSHFKTEGLRDTANGDNTINDALYEYFRNNWKLFS